MEAKDWLSGQNWTEQLRSAYIQQHHSGMFTRFKYANNSIMDICWLDTEQASVWSLRYREASTAQNIGFLIR